MPASDDARRIALAENNFMMMMIFSIDIEKNEWLPKCQANNWIAVSVFVALATKNKDFAIKRDQDQR